MKEKKFFRVTGTITVKADINEITAATDKEAAIALVLRGIKIEHYSLSAEEIPTDQAMKALGAPTLPGMPP